jgi:type VI secretion system secreted protein Hcp
LADLFLKIDGIPGESLDDKHKDEIELVSFGWGVSSPAAEGHAGGGAGAGRPHFQDFHFMTRVSKASPQLFLAVASGKHIKEASLSVRRAGKQQLEYLKIKFSDVLVTSFQEAGADGTAPEETIGFAFSRIQLEYHPQQARGGAGGAITAGWDLSKNIKV